MTGVELSRAAEADLIDIWLHIAADNDIAADRQIDHFDRVVKLLAVQPLMGVDRSALLQAGVRSFVMDRYLIFYRIGNKLQVLRVLHGACHWQALFEDLDLGGE